MKRDEGKEVRTPNVPKLLFPASFTRVGAQTVDPTLLPAPWAICDEALITYWKHKSICNQIFFGAF